jgi:hypothetical protein
MILAHFVLFFLAILCFVYCVKKCSPYIEATKLDHWYNFYRLFTMTNAPQYYVMSFYLSSIFVFATLVNLMRMIGIS